MFFTEWVKKENLVRLVDTIPDESLDAHFPRPAYSDELDLLGFAEHFRFPKEPGILVCWAVERKYYYCGELIAFIKSADIFHKPVLAFSDTKFKTLKPIDKDRLIEINKEKLFVLESESMDFVKSTYEEYSKKVDAFAVAFSGGKDSQVILDIVSRALESKTYYAAFTDTGMELPITLETVEQTQKKYSQRFSGFQMVRCASEESAVDQWERYGPPSRFSRWCCSVRKSGLFARTMKDVLKTEGQPRIVVFEGVRGDESARREKYKRVAKGVKHINLINARPIFYWNNTEVYLYCIEQDVDLNGAYKKGLTRVGCNVCPFASSWSESLINILYPDLVKPYVDTIRNLAHGVGLRSESAISDYISSGNWKKNAGGRGLSPDESRFDVICSKPNLECVLTAPKSDWKKWLSIVGEYTYGGRPDGSIAGELKLRSGIKKFEIRFKNDKMIFKFYNSGDNIFESSIIKKALTKTTFCERCGVCEAECPTGALVIRSGKFDIDLTKCVHCYSCMNVHDGTGCIVASRRKLSEGGSMNNTSGTKTSGVDKYSTFGLRDSWIDSFFDEFEDFFIDYGGLGTKQVMAALNWLREAELVEPKAKKVTGLATQLRDIYASKKFLVKQIIWINLCFNSAVVKTYATRLTPLTSYSSKDIVALMQEQYPTMAEATLKNPVGALANMFKQSSFGCEGKDQNFVSENLRMGVYSRQGTDTYFVKVGTDSISAGAIAYLLYKIAEKEDKREFTVSDFYSDDSALGPKSIFNLSRSNFCSLLNSLDNEGLLHAELVAGLENIHLLDSLSAEDVLKKWQDLHS